MTLPDPWEQDKLSSFKTTRGDQHLGFKLLCCVYYAGCMRAKPPTVLFAFSRL